MRGDVERKEASAFAKFRLLMWKNFLMQWRHPAQTAAELLVPVLAMSAILLLRWQIEPAMELETRYPSIPAHTLNYSAAVLAGMNLSQVSIAYSPENVVLEDVVRSAVAMMLTRNIEDIFPLVVDMFPDIIAAIPPELITAETVYELLKAVARVDGYNSSADLRSIYYDEEQTRKVIAAVQFPDYLADVTTDAQLPRNMSYALRFPDRPRQNSFFATGGRSWRTTLVFPLFPIPGPRFPYSFEGGNDPGYVNEMFIALQHSVSMELISRLTATDLRSLEVHIQRYPHPAYTSDLAVQLLIAMFPFFILLSFCYPATNIVRAITLEKELQLKEAMKIMGLPTWLHWTAWFCKQFILLLVAAILVVVLLKVNWFTTEEGFSDYAVFTNTPWPILFFFIMLYLIGVILLCFMFSSFFSSASTAALFMGVMWFILYIPATLLTLEESVATSLQVFSCLSINTAMALGFQIMLSEESTGGLQWSSFFVSPSAEESRLLFGHVVLMIVADCAIYLLVALYLEQVTPGAFGAPKPWYFVFQKEFWCGAQHSEEDAFTEDTPDTSGAVTQEQEPIAHTVGVKIQNLTKVYGVTIAVNNLNLKMYNDQITVLLGHNGAGKSTTISMVTGNVPPTRGSLWVAGHDVRNSPRGARAQIGFCPQHNVLFNELTIQEHLEFFARLKGLVGEELREEIHRLIEKLELTDKRNAQAQGLSGGQKRRLSVGIALCGGAKVVLLDEPTSGMDPASRRGLWDLLQKEKEGRSMILTTHFMDEADYLGDRIAIMSSGRLQCVGSPFFLKRHYGVGYTLVMVKAEAFRPELCTQLINKYIPDVEIKEDRGSEVTYTLPNEYSHNFEDMLANLEKNSAEIGFANYGLTSTTIEDVFMSVGSDVSVHSYSAESEDVMTNDSGSERPDKNGIDAGASTDYLVGASPTARGAALAWQHARCTWLKLWLVWSRSRGLLLLQVLVPLLIVGATLGVMQYMVTLADTVQARPLTLRQGFSRTDTYLSYDASSNISHAAGEAYSTFFNDRDRTLAVIENQTVDDYYLEQSQDAVRLGNMRTEVLIGATFGETVTAWFSNFGYHDVAVSLATVHGALLKARAPDAALDVDNHPLEANYERNEDLRTIVMILAAQFANGLGSSMGIVSAVFVMFYIKERVSRAKLLQKAAGIEPVVMWGSAFAFDWLWYIAISLIYIISCVAFQVEGLSSAEELGRFFLCLMIYGAAMLPFTYVLSYLFGGPAYGFVVLVFANALLGMMCAQIVEALFVAEVELVPQIMDAILQFYPLYSLVTAVKQLHEASLAEWSCMRACDSLLGIIPNLNECSLEAMCEQSDTCCLPENTFFDWDDGVLRYLLSMLATGVVSWLLLMIIEYRVTHKLFARRKKVPPPLDQSSLDDDVIDETHHVGRVRDSGLSQHNLIARQLSKYYKNHLAVNQVSFSVGEMECFGLLGVNGAGKTTTFKMLMGDEMVSHGDAFVRGHSVTTDIKSVHENIGYCPQFDAVFNELTGRETLRLFALLRGMRPPTIAATTARLAASLSFTKHLDKRVHQYSGGNKRKLSMAVALLGFGRVLFLDEPSTGVDPAAKRQVWRAVRQATAAGRSVVLTSHSMEECEALCTRLTIMVNGQFKCLGTPQHLKNKFSQGFTLTVKLRMRTDPAAVATQTTALKDFVNANFTTPKLMEEYQGLLTYYLPQRDVAWSRMFGRMELAKRELDVEDYTIAQTTLEQIFLQLTKYQVETTEL